MANKIVPHPTAPRGARLGLMFVRYDSIPNCLQRLSADNKSQQVGKELTFIDSILGIFLIFYEYSSFSAISTAVITLSILKLLCFDHYLLSPV